jgi:hypothetical protein
MSAEAELVKKISARAFEEAIDLMACLGVLRESESLGWRRLFKGQTPFGQQLWCKWRCCNEC